MDHLGSVAVLGCLTVDPSLDIEIGGIDVRDDPWAYG